MVKQCFTCLLLRIRIRSGSELNDFQEYTMATKEMYSSYFGFTEEEVDELYSRYLSRSAITGPVPVPMMKYIIILRRM